MRRRNIHYGHNPAGWVLCGVLAVYFLEELSALPFQSFWGNSLTGLYMLGGLLMVFRRNRSCKTSVYYIALGVLSGSISLYFHSPPPVVEAFPPREFTGEIKVSRIFQNSKGTPYLRGLGNIQADKESLWAPYTKSTLYFSLNYPPDSQVREGSLLTTRGVLKEKSLIHPQNGFERYLLKEGVTLELSQGSLLAYEHPPLIHLRERAWGTIQHALGIQTTHRHREQSAMIGMFLGDTGQLSSEDLQLFRDSGTIHLFAISGLHIAILSGSLLLILRFLRLPAQALLISCILLLGLYVWITGSSPSALRAWVMISLYLSGFAIARKSDPWRALTLSALIFLLYSPALLTQPGFQISYSVVAVILLWGIPLLSITPFEHYIGSGYPFSTLTGVQRRLRKIIRAFRTILIIGASASLGSSPWILSYFKLLTPGGILMNFPASIVATGVLSSSMLSLFFSLLHLDWVSGFLNQSSLLLLALFIRWIEFFLSIPGLSMNTLFSPSPLYTGFLTLSGILLLIYSHTFSRFFSILALLLYPLWIIGGMGIGLMQVQ